MCDACDDYCGIYVIQLLLCEWGIIYVKKQIKQKILCYFANCYTWQTCPLLSVVDMALGKMTSTLSPTRHFAESHRHGTRQRLPCLPSVASKALGKDLIYVGCH